MKDIPSDKTILRTAVRCKLNHEDPNYLDQIKLAFDFIDAQLDSGDRNGPEIPLKHQIENWAGYYICHDAVLVALKLHGLRGLSKTPVFPRPERLYNHKVAGMHGYSGHLLVKKDDLCKYPYSELDPNWLGYRGVEKLEPNCGRRINDLKDAIEELKKVQKVIQEQRGGDK